ncbi:MAG: Coenzyme F420 hydrogenase/dehydrogenase, beta subunit C-terminal domain [Candidatus Cryptobacteroides sp.]
MIDIKDNTRCCGCTACVAACPVGCIVMRRDMEGFDYPFANPDLCIGCGKCNEVCPMDKAPEPAEPLRCWAARNDGASGASSSGGVFPAVASGILSEGGAVFGAAFDDVRTVGHREVEDEAGIAALQGSKYVQSDMYSCYEDVLSCLNEGRKVLFSGTPCQVAGLKAYLPREYDNLVCIDCACHGVPGPGLWSKYVDAVGKNLGAEVRSVDFRDGSSGWMKYSIAFSLSDGRVVRIPKDNDPYMALFFQDMTLRPSCYDCQYRCFRSGSDITLADLWNVRGIAPRLADGRGVSFVGANTAKGLEIIESLENICRQEVDWRVAVAGNGGFSSSCEMPARRAAFFTGLPVTSALIPYMRSFVVSKPLFVRMYRSLHSSLSRMKSKLLKK